MTARLSDKTLVKIQAVSGLAFAMFLALHLANTVLASAGQETYNAFQRAARWYYQFPLVEVTAVLGAALAHMWAGVARILRRRRLHEENPRAAAAPSRRMRLHRWSGYYLLAAFAGHVLATRIVPALVDLQVEFSLLTFSLTNWPYFFYPYYALLFASGAFHLAHGAATALRVLGVGVPRWWTATDAKAFWAGVAAASAAGLLAVLALGGNLFEVNTSAFPQIEAAYHKVMEFVSTDDDRIADAK